MAFKVGKKSMPKDLVEFDDLVKCVMDVKDKGYDMKGIDQYSSRLFGFFLGLCLVTGQRNRTIREVKFDDFTKNKGKCYVSLFATKTRK